MAQHKGEWYITREHMPPADLGKNPKQWRKAEQVRHPDRRPIRSRIEAQALMIARVEERRHLESEVREIIRVAAERPAPIWTPAPSNQSSRTRRRVCGHGPRLTYWPNGATA
ncbi:hypothetical protein ACQEVM_37425 [Streptomyces sp. CA-243310]|uniref:hypothetical protein n=1 Tax=Streptomyces sp. CA-243310 TaxID=3240056 RepID=UPI003D8C7CA0